MQNNANLRKWFALLIAIIAYYIIHEGSHAIIAILFGAFEEIRLLGIGMQVVSKTELMSAWQQGVFAITGSFSTLLAAYLLLALTKHILQTKSRLIKAIGYYTTLALLLLDPIYLAFLYRFFGGGDMNGIKLLGIPEIAWQIIYALIAAVNLLLIVKYVCPSYKKAFNQAE